MTNGPLSIRLAGQFYYGAREGWGPRFDFFVGDESLHSLVERSRGEALPYVSVLLLRRPPWRRLVRGRLLCDPGPFGQPACELVARAGGALGAGQEAEERIHLMFQRDIFPFYLCPACLDIFCSAVFGVVVREGDVYRWRFDGLALSFSKANYESTLETFDGEGEPPRAGEPDGPS